MTLAKTLSGSHPAHGGVPNPRLAGDRLALDAPHSVALRRARCARLTRRRRPQQRTTSRPKTARQTRRPPRLLLLVEVCAGVGLEDDLVVVVDRESLVEDEGDVVLDEKARETGHRHRMCVEVERQGQVADLVDGEEGPVAHYESVHVLLERDAALELV